MKLGFIGLGKMGRNMVVHLKEQGIEVVAYNRTPKALSTVQSLPNLVKSLTPPRTIWLMVTAGAPVDELLDSLIASGLQNGDIVIDGGNSFYKDTIRRYNKLLKSGIHYVDCGVSGGVEAARHGACLMVGGDRGVVESLTWLWDALAIKDGWGYLGDSGAGHFVKMVHNGVEYGMNESLGEGFAILEKSTYHLDLQKVADLWSHGSVVRGWLIQLLANALHEDPHLDNLTGHVGGGESGRQALDTAHELGVKAEVLEESLEAREESQTNPTFAGKVVSALRKQYGGHEEHK